MYTYIIDKTQEYAKEKLAQYDASHDWEHTERVYKNAILLVKEEAHADVFVVQMAALLHDVFDHKFGFSEEVRTKNLMEYLASYRMAENYSKHIISIVNNISFSQQEEKQLTLEGQIVQDADRLDAIGAIGIARAFTYGGAHNRKTYIPTDSEEGGDDTLSHFSQKLVKIKDLMKTQGGAREAQRRHDFVEQFLTEFYHEIG